MTIDISNLISVSKKPLSKPSYARSYNFAVVGATGIVGKEVLSILSENRIPVASIKGLASENSAGEKIEFGEEEIVVEKLTENSFQGVDVAFFCASSEIARTFVPHAKKAGTVSIDKSSAFRMDSDVPLVVPEVNASEIRNYKTKMVISSPNCTAIPLAQVLAPLHQAAIIKRVVVSSYQAVSGAGKAGLEELDKQTRDLFNLREPQTNVFKNRIAFNVLPCIPTEGNFSPDGSTEEEEKVIEETRRILNLPQLKIAATCVRVPVFNGHSEAVNIEFETELSVKKARDVLANASSVVVIDDTSNLIFPTPADASGEDYTLVGRIRGDNSVQHGISLWLTSDNLRTGAALNAVRIAEILCSKHLN